MDLEKDPDLHDILDVSGFMVSLKQALRVKVAGLGFLGVPCNSFNWMSSPQHRRTYYGHAGSPERRCETEMAFFYQPKSHGFLRSPTISSKKCTKCCEILQFTTQVSLNRVAQRLKRLCKACLELKASARSLSSSSRRPQTAAKSISLHSKRPVSSLFLLHLYR